MAISWKAVPIRTNAQEIATAYGLAMTYWVHAANSPHIVTVHRVYRITPSVMLTHDNRLRAVPLRL